jgi:hypothetical protein
VVEEHPGSGYVMQLSVDVSTPHFEDVRERVT